MRSSSFSSNRRRVLSIVTALALACATGCSDGEDGDPAGADPTALLAGARTTLDRTETLHFTLTSADVPGNGTRLVGGRGTVARPKSFQGTLSVLLNDSKVSIELISTGGTVYAKLPFSSDFQVTDPSTFGLSDPANLIDRKAGLDRMFGELTGITSKGELRIGNDVVTQLDGSLPGTLVEDLLTSADPAKPVRAELYITKSSKQLRRVVLTGPFFEPAQDSTFNLLLDQYGTPVTITAPATS
jgi:hypothetical protein